MSRNLSNNAVAVDLRSSTSAEVSPEACAPRPVRPAAKGDHYWFVFDRWLPTAARPEDEFVLA